VHASAGTHLDAIPYLYIKDLRRRVCILLLLRRALLHS
jgi:hypothetical protein